QTLTGLAATSTFLLVTVAQIWALLVQATPKRNSLSRLLAFLHIYVGLIIMPFLNDVIPAPGMEALSMPYLPGSVINTCWGMLEGFEPGSQLLGAVAVVPSYAALQLHREWRAWSAQPGPGPCTVHAMTASAGITAALMLSGVDRNKLVRSASQARQLLDDLLPR
ncbi:hypothetical protein HaLaN_18950, partial [Haematococcus lacustris]